MAPVSPTQRGLLANHGRLGTAAADALDLTLSGEETPPARAFDEARDLSFIEVFRRHDHGVLGMLRRLRVADADVEDVAQEVFLAVHVQLSRFEQRSSVKTWIHSIALRKAVDYRRRAWRRRELSEAIVDLPAQEAEQELLVLRAQRAQLLERALTLLPDEQLTVFVLHEVEQLPMREVARALDCPRFTAYSRLRAARQVLKAVFAREGGVSAATPSIRKVK